MTGRRRLERAIEELLVRRLQSKGFDACRPMNEADVFLEIRGRYNKLECNLTRLAVDIVDLILTEAA